MLHILQKIHEHPRLCHGIQVLIMKGHQHHNTKKSLLAAPQLPSLLKGQAWPGQLWVSGEHFSYFLIWLLFYSFVTQAREVLWSTRVQTQVGSQHIGQGRGTAGSCAKSGTRALWCQPLSHSLWAVGWQQMGATHPSCSSGLAHHHTCRHGCHTPTGACIDHSSLLAEKGKGREQHRHSTHTHHQCVHRGAGRQAYLELHRVHSIVIPFFSSSPGCSLKNPQLQTASPHTAIPAQQGEDELNFASHIGRNQKRIY